MTYIQVCEKRFVQNSTIVRLTLVDRAEVVGLYKGCVEKGVQLLTVDGSTVIEYVDVHTALEVPPMELLRAYMLCR